MLRQGVNVIFVFAERKMLDKSEVKAFFDTRAACWDDISLSDGNTIRKILDYANVKSGMDVLDVACGTGVLFPYCLERGVSSVTGVDISSEMTKIALEKYAAEPRIKVVCTDVEEAVFDRQFDIVLVYNALPHFFDAKRLIKKLSSFLKDGGRLTVAHGASREEINACHKGSAEKVSLGLMSAEELKELFLPYFETDIVISDETMYQVSGTKK